MSVTSITLGNDPTRPEWLIIGQPLPDGRKRVIASQCLSYAELEMKARDFGFSGYDLEPLVLAYSFPEITLTVRMYPRGQGDLVLIEGLTYKDCLAQLEIVCTYCGACIIGTTCKACGAPRTSLIDKAEARA